MDQEILGRRVGTGAVPSHVPFRGGVAGQAHNEVAFRHFLGIELRRAQRSGQTVLLALVSMPVSPGRNATVTTADAARMFSALGASIREVDFVGWFHEGRVAAAALIQRAATPAGARQLIADRVTHSLRVQLADSSRPLRVRVICLRGKAGR